MSHSSEILEILENWHCKRFRDTEITLSEAVASLGSDNPLVEAKPGTSILRWVLMNKETNKVATLTHAGICAWDSDLDTGNYVPAGEVAPIGLPEHRIQDTPSYKCEYTYPFDTTVDTSLWDHLKIVEQHALQQEGFNRAGRKRRQWQSGIQERRSYLASSRIFSRRTPYNTKDGGEFNVHYDVHPWVLDAIQDNPEAQLIPNPDRPRYYHYDEDDEVLQDLRSSNTPTFERGDIIWMSFRVGFVISQTSWWSEIIPLELVRVRKLPERVVSASDSAMYPVDPEYIPLEANKQIKAIVGAPVQLGKRKEGPSYEEADVDAHPSKKHFALSDHDMMDDIESSHDDVVVKVNTIERRNKKGSKSSNRPF